ncbi:hypothetical protein SEUCBS140593_000897 [Sporothrix eucalyptigena]|uniref:Uncharacterized protein n=1 Tax=Sporothrix eucalyptigena TaxID=1812306 RepID=A0ABP0ATR6_9PEZI
MTLYMRYHKRPLIISATVILGCFLFISSFNEYAPSAATIVSNAGEAIMKNMAPTRSNPALPTGILANEIAIETAVPNVAVADVGFSNAAVVDDDTPTDMAPEFVDDFEVAKPEDFELVNSMLPATTDSELDQPLGRSNDEWEDPRTSNIPENLRNAFYYYGDVLVDGPKPRPYVGRPPAYLEPPLPTQASTAPAKSTEMTAAENETDSINSTIKALAQFMNELNRNQATIDHVISTFEHEHNPDVTLEMSNEARALWQQLKHVSGNTMDAAADLSRFMGHIQGLRETMQRIEEMTAYTKAYSISHSNNVDGVQKESKNWM